MANPFQYLPISSDKLESVPIVNGRLINVTDTQESYYDYNGKRIKIASIITVPTYAALKKIMNPIKGKFYYVEDEELSQLYYYNGNKFIKTAGYSHPVYTAISGVWYGGITVNQQGHVTEASNKPIPVEYGGTGVDNLDALMGKMNAASKKDIQEISDQFDDLKLVVDNHNAAITQINKDINDTNDSLEESVTDLQGKIDGLATDLESHKLDYSDTISKVENIETEIDRINEAITNTDDNLQTSTEEIQESINSLRDLISTMKNEIQDQLDQVVNSYYVRDLEASDWIKDNADDSYYIMLVRAEYTDVAMLVFPIVQIYTMIDDSYIMSYGYYDNKDYKVTIDSNQNITITTKNAFPCRVVIHSLFDGNGGTDRVYKD